MIFSNLCLLCNDIVLTKENICQACLHDFPVINHSCQRCGIPLKAATEVCGTCQTQTLATDRVYSAFYHENAPRYLIHQLKFGKQLIYAKAIAHSLVQVLYSRGLTKHTLTHSSFLVPVPLHSKRIRQRGFNQSMEICRHLSKQLEIPILSNVLKRTLDTPPQTGLSKVERKKNLNNAFHIDPDRVVKCQNAKKIILIDDVITTGSTINHIAKILKIHGIQHVEAWSYTRAI